MTEKPDYSHISDFPDGRTATEYAQGYQKLVGDAQRGERPSPEELANAPRIAAWEIKPLSNPNLEREVGYPPLQIWGYFEGHPVLRNNEYGHSSLVLQVDPEGKWARCASRVYRLGNPKGGPEAV